MEHTSFHLSITADIEGSITRVDGLDATTFEAGDTIGLYILDGDSTAYDEASNCYNVPAVYDGSQWTILKTIYLTDEDATVLAYYPYDESHGYTAATYSNGIFMDVAGQTDALYSSAKTANLSNTEVNLQFHHRLSRITLNVEVDSDIESLIVTSAGVKCGEEILYSDFSFYTEGDAMTTAYGSATNEMSTTFSSATISPSSPGSFDILVLTQEDGLYEECAKLKIDGITYTVELPSLTDNWKEGYHYIYNLKATKASSDDDDDTSDSSDSTDNSGSTDDDDSSSGSGSSDDDGGSSNDDSGSSDDSSTDNNGSTDDSGSSDGNSDSSDDSGSSGDSDSADDSSSTTYIILEVTSASYIESWTDAGTSDEIGVEVEIDYNGHEYVDLGLSVKWATMNVGASSASDYGDYFAWGETETKSNYSESYSVTYGVSGIKDFSGNSTYDAAKAYWGGSWRMPTYNELKELDEECSWSRKKIDGIYGYQVTGPNGNTIFLPIGGLKNGTKTYYSTEDGRYWSSTPYKGDNVKAAYDLEISVSSGSTAHYTALGWRYMGQAIRPVSY